MTDGASDNSAQSWDATQASLEAALVKVADLGDLPKRGIPYRVGIPTIARQLAMMMPTGLSQPHLEPATHETTIRELGLVAKKAKAMLSAVEALHQPAIDALGYHPPWPRGIGGLETQLRILLAMAENAPLTDQNRSAGRGAKVKAQPQAIARVAACHFFGLTGRMPTLRVREGKAYGPFLEFITSIFECLGIDAKPESQASSAITFMKKTPRKNWPITPLDNPPKA